MVQDKGKLVHSHPANELTEKLFGIESVVCKEKIADATYTTFALRSDSVPSGKIWKITRVVAYNYDGDIPTQLQFCVMHIDNWIMFHQKEGVIAIRVPVALNVELYLDAGDYIQASFYGIETGETCYLNIFGYEMNAP